MEAYASLHAVVGESSQRRAQRTLDDWGLVRLPVFVLSHMGPAALTAAAKCSAGEGVIEELVEWWLFALGDAGCGISDEVLGEVCFMTREAISEAVDGEDGEAAGRILGGMLFCRLDQIRRRGGLALAA